MKGASEIGFTVLSMSTSLVAVFIPILLMSGIVGRLFREFAVTLSAAIARVALRFSDRHADDVRAVSPPRDWPARRLYRFSEGGFNRLLRTYDLSFRWVLRHQFLISACSHFSPSA